MEASELFENAIIWLKEHYAQFQFFVERDVVWTLQLYLIRQIREQSLPYPVFNDYPILPGTRRSLCVDLAILNTENLIEGAAEFKYEPSHQRAEFKYESSHQQADIWPTKFTPSATTHVVWSEGRIGCPYKVASKEASRSKLCLRNVDK